MLHRANGKTSRRSVSGKINHKDFAVLWPSTPADGTVAFGVTPLWNNPLPDTLRDAIVFPRACRPVVIRLGNIVPPAQPGISAGDLLSSDGVTVHLENRYVFALSNPDPTFEDVVGRPLTVDVDTRASAWFASK